MNGCDVSGSRRSHCACAANDVPPGNCVALFALAFLDVFARLAGFARFGALAALQVETARAEDGVH